MNELLNSCNHFRNSYLRYLEPIYLDLFERLEELGILGEVSFDYSFGGLSIECGSSHIIVQHEFLPSLPGSDPCDSLSGLNDFDALLSFGYSCNTFNLRLPVPDLSGDLEDMVNDFTGFIYVDFDTALEISDFLDRYSKAIYSNSSRIDRELNLALDSMLSNCNLL